MGPQTVRIADGAETGFYEFGDPKGAPIFALHGVPACDFEQTARMMLKLSQRRHQVARLFMSTCAPLARLSPKSAVKSFANELSPSDRAIIPELGSAQEAMALFTGAFLRGSRGVI